MSQAAGCLRKVTPPGSGSSIYCQDSAKTGGLHRVSSRPAYVPLPRMTAFNGGLQEAGSPSLSHQQQLPGNPEQVYQAALLSLIMDTIGSTGYPGAAELGKFLPPAEDQAVARPPGLELPITNLDLVMGVDLTTAYSPGSSMTRSPECMEHLSIEDFDYDQAPEPSGTIISVDGLGQQLRAIWTIPQERIAVIRHGLKRMDLEQCPFQLRDHFRQFGDVTGIYLWLSRVQSRNRQRVSPGRCFVVMGSAASRERLLQHGKVHEVDGHQIEVAPFQHAPCHDRPPVLRKATDRARQWEEAQPFRAGEVMRQPFDHSLQARGLRGI